MTEKENKQKVSIDGKEYILDDLPQTAKDQIYNIQFVDSQIQRLNNEWAISDTARIGYTNALKTDTAKNKSSG